MFSLRRFARCCALSLILAAATLLSADAHAASPASITAQFAGMTGKGWTGADGAWSAPLPGGRVVWVFGDTFIGGVDSTGRRTGATMIHNSIVLQQRDGSMRTITGGTTDAPGSLVPGAGADDWYWPGQPVVGRGVLQVPMVHLVHTGSGIWDFKADRTDVATFALPSLRLQSVTHVATPEGISMTAAAVTAGGFTYLYGAKDAGIGYAVKDAYVARAPAGKLDTTWSYWTGSSWRTDPTAAAPIARGVSDQFSVVRTGSRWTLVTQQPLTGEIHAFRADTPQGTWASLGKIADIGVVAGGVTYSATLHPELSHGSHMVLGFSVNAADWDPTGKPATLYRPRFVTVDLPA